MAGGLLQLVAYGAQDVYLTGNPQITFFKVVYRRHTNFAIESIEQTFNGTSSIGSRVSVLITRNGDLINRIYYKGKITNINTGGKSCALVPYFGLRLLRNIELEIGGQKIDKHHSEWMYIWNELSMPVGKKDGYNKMVGGNKRNSSITLSPNESYTIYVPLEFWFCRNVGLALPLIALQYHEVKINIEYAQLSDMVDTTIGNYSYKNDDRESTDNNSMAKTIELEDSELWVDYIFLDTDERRRFAQLSHEYLIEQLQYTGSEKIISGVTTSGQISLKSVKLNFNHPCKEIVWVVKPDAQPIGYHNDDDTAYRKSLSASKPYWNNFSNNEYNEYNHYDTTNVPSYYNCENPVKAVKLQLNGNERFSEREGEYFSIVQPYQHHENTPGNYNKGINLYSFALKPEEHQPSGTLNMSRIDSAHLQIATEKKGFINIFAINYNVLRILSGMGGLAYSN